VRHRHRQFAEPLRTNGPLDVVGDGQRARQFTDACLRGELPSSGSADENFIGDFADALA